MYEVVILGDSQTNDAVQSLLHITLTHVADFQVKMLKVVSDTFGLKMEDLIEAIKDSPEFQKKYLEEEVIAAEVVKPVKTKKGRKVIIK